MLTVEQTDMHDDQPQQPAIPVDTLPGWDDDDLDDGKRHSLNITTLDDGTHVIEYDGITETGAAAFDVAVRLYTLRGIRRVDVRWTPGPLTGFALDHVGLSIADMFRALAGLE